MAAVRISLHGLRLPVRLGWGDEERSSPQIVVADVVVMVSAQRSFRSDELDDSLDYVRVVELLERCASSDSWRLVEKLTWDLLSALFARFERVVQVRIDLRKNILTNLQGVSVGLDMAREEWLTLKGRDHER